MKRKTQRKIAKAINKTASVVSKATGGGALVDFAGAKLAKSRLPKSQRKFVKDTTTKKQALGSALLVGTSMVGVTGAIRGIGGRLASKGGRKVVKKVATKKVAKKTKTPKVKVWTKNKKPGKDVTAGRAQTKFLKRTLKGRETAQRQKAKKRIKRK